MTIVWPTAQGRDFKYIVQKKLKINNYFDTAYENIFYIDNYHC